MMNTRVYTTENNQYEHFEKLSPSSFTRRCIDNTITGSNKCVGYCQYSGHPGFLTDKQRKEHNCIGKQCYHYLPKPQKNKHLQKTIIDQSKTVLSTIRRLMLDNEGIRVLRVENHNINRYAAFYVTITNECELSSYETRVQRELGVEIDFVRLDYDFDKCVALLYAG